MVRALDSARELLNQPVISQLGKAEWRPGKGCHTQTEKEAYIRQHAESIYHPVGTCRMGKDEDSVVDTKLALRGVEGLWVADASIMPKIVSGNTNAPSIMIGERAADFVEDALG